MSHILNLFQFNYVLVVLSIVIAFLVSFRMFPVIIFISQKKRLMEKPGERNSHIVETPSLGGVGLFVAFSLSFILLGMISGLDQSDLIKLLSVLGATIILVFLGIKDDLIILAPKQKLMGQIISAFIVIFMTDVRIDNFNGLLGVYEIPYFVSVVFTLFVFILVINAYNLVDGIDGLAGSLAIIASVSFGIFFVLNNHYLFLLISFVLIGALIGFLRYNLSDKHKLFMGDSGSLFIGYLLAYQGVSFLYLNSLENITFHIPNAPIILIAALSFPLLDTLRVFAIRIKEKRSPFTADRNHIHHRFLDIGCTHKEATLAISIANILVVAVAVSLTFLQLNINLQLLIAVVIGISLYLLPFMISLKQDKLAIPQQSNNYSLSMDMEELERQVKHRNRLLAKKGTSNRGYSENEHNIIILDNSDLAMGLSGDKLREIYTNKRSRYMRYLKPTKHKFTEDI